MKLIPIVLAMIWWGSALAQAPQNSSTKDQANIETLARQVQALQTQLKLVEEQLAQMRSPAPAASPVQAPPASPAQMPVAEEVKPADAQVDGQMPASDAESHKLGPFQMRALANWVSAALCLKSCRTLCSRAAPTHLQLATSIFSPPPASPTG